MSIYDAMFTLFVDRTRSRPTQANAPKVYNLRYVLFRFQFSGKERKPDDNHSHPNARYDREVGVESIRDFLRKNGLISYDPSRADAARDKDVIGHRLAYSAQDLSKDFEYPTYFKYRQSDIVTLIDQDYYYTPQQIASFAPKPMAIWTLNVNSLSGRDSPDSSFFYRSPTEIVENVNGGATYIQALNNYATDRLVMQHKTFGFWPSFTVYDVNRICQPGTAKMAVFLTPSSTHYVSVSLFQKMSKWLTGRDFDLPVFSKEHESDTIRVIKGKYNDFLLGCFGTHDNPIYSIKRVNDVGPDSAVDLTESVYKALSYLSAEASNGWCAKEADRYTTAWGKKIEGAHLYTLVEFFDIPAPLRESPNYCIIPKRPGSFYDVGPLKAGYSFPPITNQGGKVQSLNKESAESYKELRVYPNINTTIPPDKYLTYRDEFLKQFVRRPHEAVPEELGTVLKEQNRAIQVARNQTEIRHTDNSEGEGETSMKKEVTEKMGAARGVNLMPTDHTLNSSRIDRGAKVVFKRNKSWAVGYNPHTIAKMVQELANITEPEYINVETDFSKMDETVSAWLRKEVFNEAMLRVYRVDHHDYVRATLDFDWNCIVKCAGKPLLSQDKNKSGSGFTTTINTIINAFVKFCINRELGMGILDSFKHIGLCYGDDGLNTGPKRIQPGRTIQEIKEEYTAVSMKVASDLGLKLKTILHEANSGYFFLGRQYPDPSVSLTSYGKISSSLKKVNTVVNMNNVTAAANRLKGYWVTESHVPLVSDYIEAGARVLGVDLSKPLDVKYEDNKDLYYRAKNGPLPFDPLTDTKRLLTAVAHDLDLGVGEVLQRVKSLMNVKTKADFDQVYKVVLPEVEEPDFALTF